MIKAYLEKKIKKKKGSQERKQNSRLARFRHELSADSHALLRWKPVLQYSIIPTGKERVWVGLPRDKGHLQKIHRITRIHWFRIAKVG